MKENRRIEKKERVVDAAESNENKLSAAIYLKTRERKKKWDRGGNNEVLAVWK